MFPILFILLVLTIIGMGFMYLLSPTPSGAFSPTTARRQLHSDSDDQAALTGGDQDVFDIDTNGRPMVDQSGFAFSPDPFTSNMVDTTFTGGQPLDSFPESHSFDHDDKYD